MINIYKHHGVQRLCSVRRSCKRAKKKTHRERGEGHAHAPKSIESQGNEDKDGEFCKGHRC